MNAPPKGGRRRRGLLHSLATTTTCGHEKRRELSFQSSSPDRLLQSHRHSFFFLFPRDDPLARCSYTYTVTTGCPRACLYDFLRRSFCREPPAAASRSTIATRSIHNDRGTTPPSPPSLFLSHYSIAISRRDSAKWYEHVRTIVRFVNDGPRRVTTRGANCIFRLLYSALCTTEYFLCLNCDEFE